MIRRLIFGLSLAVLGLPALAGPPTTAEAAQPPRDVWFPSGTLFSPLVADPRWPGFGVSYHRYVNDRYLERAYTVALGASIPVWRSASGDLEWGFQGGAWSVFDRDKPSVDQFNTDFLGSLFIAGRLGQGDAAYLVRAMHTSTHLGDEYLLNEPDLERENFSFERLDGFVSDTFPLADDDWIGRFYAGVGVALGEPNPSDWSDVRAQWGVELRGRPFGFGGTPFIAADVQHEEARDFTPDLSLRAGIELPRSDHGSAFRAGIDYYVGREPNGQFWRDDVQMIGVGLHFTF